MYFFCLLLLCMCLNMRKKYEKSNLEHEFEFFMCGSCTCERWLGFSWTEGPSYYDWLIITLQIMKYFIITIFILKEYCTKLRTLASTLHICILDKHAMLNAISLMQPMHTPIQKFRISNSSTKAKMTFAILPWLNS